MVSLLISKLGKRITDHPPVAIYDILKDRGYLSAKALSARPAVVSVLERVEDSWPPMPAPGAEKWRDMQAALSEGGFLNAAGLRATRRFVSRR